MLMLSYYLKTMLKIWMLQLCSPYVIQRHYLGNVNRLRKALCDHMMAHLQLNYTMKYW